jgi:hypothetical protein
VLKARSALYNFKIVSRSSIIPVDFIFVDVANLQMELGYVILVPRARLTCGQHRMTTVEGNKNGMKARSALSNIKIVSRSSTSTFGNNDLTLDRNR